MGDVLLDVRGDGVAVVELNRPEQRNALSTSLKTALLEALQQVAADESVRAVVLTGAGSAFTVGQDLGELATDLRADPASVGATVELHYNPITLLLATMPKPVVAAVNGTCVGAGLGFALACDLQVWSSTATLATAFTKVGLTCDSGLSATLARAVGIPRATELILLAEPFTPAQGVAWGMAGAVVDPDDVRGEAIRLATSLAAGPTLAIAASKRLLAASPWRPLAETLADESREQVALGLTADHRAAVEAFLARRQPSFEGR